MTDPSDELPNVRHPGSMSRPAVQQVERYVRARRDTNKRLISWPLYFFLLIWITCGIYGIIVYWQRIARTDAFRQRKQAYYRALIAYTRQFAQDQGSYDSVYSELDDLDRDVKTRFDSQLKPINPGLSLLLSIVTFGIWTFVVWYRLDRFWLEIQRTEEDFDDKLGQTWMRLGMIRHPVSYDVDLSVERSFGLYLALSFLTIGIWSIVWDYKIHTDPERLYHEFDAAEDGFLAALRQAG